jgi:Spy/CpxP family protein refolding chaperone
MKLAIALAAVFALLAGTAHTSLAGHGPGMGGHGKKHFRCGVHCMGPGARLDMLTAHLKLTPEQRLKLLPILDEDFAKKKAIREDGSLTRDQRKAKMEELRNACHEKISAILTPEQKVKADEMKAAAAQRFKARQEGMKGREGKGMHAMDPAAHLERMSACLGLTADQKTKISPILIEQSKEMKSLHDDAKLTRDQRIQKMQELRVKYHDKIGALLTPDQKTKFGAQGPCNGGGRGMGHGPMMQGTTPATPPAK